MVNIGDQWRAEPEEVRALYKQKAEDAKRQHERDHPGYQYQLRKPSEKKKRMTKNKLAKMAKTQAEASGLDVTKQALPDDFDRIAFLDQSLSECATYQPLKVNSYGKDPQPQQPILQKSKEQNAIIFETGPDFEDRLRASLQEFNAQIPVETLAIPAQPASFWEPATSATTVELPPNPVASIAAKHLIDGEPAYTTPRFPLELSAATKQIVSAPWAQDFNSSKSSNIITETAPASSVATGPMPVTQPNVGAEVERQDQLDEDFASFIDMDAYNNTPESEHVGSTGSSFVHAACEDAEMPSFMIDMPNDENNMPSFANSFELDFGDNALDL